MAELRRWLQAAIGFPDLFWFCRLDARFALNKDGLMEADRQELLAFLQSQKSQS